MSLTSIQILENLQLFLDEQPCDGTLKLLQRAVLNKGFQAISRDGHWPIVDFPTALQGSVANNPQLAQAVGGACALFYAFADITDDAQDHDLKPEPWAIWGWEQAVNTGSSLLFQCFQYLYQQLGSSKAGPGVFALSRAGLTMTYGQHRDLLGQSTPDASFAHYLKTVEQKSGASFGVYAELVALINDLPHEEVRAYRAAGESLGATFQMMSDTFELWSGRYSDLQNQRLTLPIVLALEHLEGESRDRFLDLLRSTTGNPAPLVSFLEEAGIKGYATFRIEVYKRRAMELARSLGFDRIPYVAQLLDSPAFPQNYIAI